MAVRGRKNSRELLRKRSITRGSHGIKKIRVTNN